VVALLNGVRIFRVHDVAATRRALAVAESIRRAQ
jgi:dihydropteroate synthase